LGKVQKNFIKAGIECEQGINPTFSEFSENEWNQLRWGYNLDMALHYAVNESEIDQHSLENPAEHFRLYGIGNVYEIGVD
jgi:hypothetical protein